jgi:hypothetical protein
MAKAAYLRKPKNRQEWITSARNQPTFLASAGNLPAVANFMHAVEFVEIGDCIRLSPMVAALGYRADEPTLRRIAKLLLEKAPPAWLESALTRPGLALEYIPTHDLSALHWLGDELEIILKDVSTKKSRQKDDELAARLGNAGELIVMASKKLSGENPVRVSAISDSYGYDIESYSALGLERVEVKAAVQKTKGSFFITRNEYEKSLRYKSEWYLLQVVFSPAVLFQNNVKRADVLNATVLSSAILHDLIPPDSAVFRWMQSALVRPDEKDWVSYDLQLPDDLVVELK